MAVRGSRSAQRAREEAERARLYAARKDWHDSRLRRRHRDTVIAVAAGGAIVIGALVSQVIHAQVTTPAPDPSPSGTPAPSVAPTTEPTTVPILPNAPSDGPTPLPTQTLDD
ncbi:hypothetical protein [Microbacterium neungamense]|uniref:hypothetical protein n=1 Tax=Microbacterium neungamense TaxID=2810535 RepID=UPI00217E4409|nr:hypothetical protein [Microbacterium neungamense]UWF76526.1 hypothetical protein JSY13_06385 [Microbacterium neungamense]